MGVFAEARLMLAESRRQWRVLMAPLDGAWCDYPPLHPTVV
jgi:hypothetical protein